MAKNPKNKNTNPDKTPKKPESNVKKDNKIKPSPEIFPQEETPELPVAEITPAIEPEVETPADAPTAPVNPEAPVVAEDSRPADDEATAPPPKNKIVPAAPDREEKVGEQAPAETASLPEAVAPPISKEDMYIGPGSAHSDEKKLERYLKNRNNVTKLTHIQLGQSGINMSKIGLLLGRVGKFKLKRDFIVESWKITIE